MKRPTKSPSRAWRPRHLARDPLRIVELAVVICGTIVSAASSYFAWQAAASTAEQARYAQAALTAADMNATFRTYISSWNRICNAITAPEYYLTVGTPVFDADGRLVVSVTNLGFDRASFDIAKYIDRVAGAEDVAKGTLLEFRTFLPTDAFDRTEQAAIIISYFYFSPDYLDDGPDELMTQIVRAAALCRYYTEEQMKWFRDRSYKIQPVISSLFRLDIRYSTKEPPTPRPR